MKIEELRLGMEVIYQNPGYEPMEGYVAYLAPPGVDVHDPDFYIVSRFKRRLDFQLVTGATPPGWLTRTDAREFEVSARSRFTGDQIGPVLILVENPTRNGRMEWRSPPLTRLKPLKEV